MRQLRCSSLPTLNIQPLKIVEFVDSNDTNQRQDEAVAKRRRGLGTKSLSRKPESDVSPNLGDPERALPLCLTNKH